VCNRLELQKFGFPHFNFLTSFLPPSPFSTLLTVQPLNVQILKQQQQRQQLQQQQQGQERQYQQLRHQQQLHQQQQLYQKPAAAIITTTAFATTLTTIAVMTTSKRPISLFKFVLGFRVSKIIHAFR